MRLSRRSSLLLRLGTGFTLAFIYLPLVLITIYAFSKARTFVWPPPALTFDWFDRAFSNEGARDALFFSAKTGLFATSIALILGTLASLAVARHSFFGRETI